MEKSMKRHFWVVIFGLVLGATGYALGQHTGKGDKTSGLNYKVLMEQVLKEKIDNQEAKVTVWELEKAPGTGSAEHRHPGPVFVYVLEGELESKVGDQPMKVYKKGEMFYEPAHGLHAVSRNPSLTKSTRILVFFLTSKDEKTFVIPEKP
jgi:quercetin dioxygenase-like cupin family protein